MARVSAAACRPRRLALLLSLLLAPLAVSAVVGGGAERMPLAADTYDDEDVVEYSERLFAIHEAGILEDGPAAVARLKDAVPDTVPADVQCEKVKRCDRKKVCAVVCKPGSVVIDPWLDRALALQRQLSFRRNFCQAQLPGSHNSAINLADGYGVEDHVFEGYLKYISWIKKDMQVHTNDQLFSLTDQLHMGVRFLELDIHWFDNDLRIAHCGGFSSKLLDKFIEALNKIAKMLGSDIQWDTETIGCKPSLSSIPANEQRSLKEALKEVADWLHAPEHQDEFLMIFFDDEASLKKWKKIPTLLTYIKQYFSMDEMLLPSDFEYAPTWPSFHELIGIGKRVVFMSGTDYSPDGDEILFLKNTICDWTEPKLPLNPYPICNFTKPKISPANMDRTIFRPETSEIQYGFLNADGQLGGNKDLLDEKSLPEFFKCGVNIPSPDNITPKRMEATIWSLDRAHALDQQKCVGLLRNSSKWQSVDCARVNMAPACVGQANSLQWKLGGSSVRESDSSAACTALSMVYSVPATGYENQIVYKLLEEAPKNVEGVWVDAKQLVEDVFFTSQTRSSADVPQNDGELAFQPVFSLDALDAVE